jgi:hypothetical protein
MMQQEMVNKTFFTIHPHSIVDIITNSSSELFVFGGSGKDTVKELIKEFYPDYLNEYEELKSIDELTLDELDTYFTYACSAHMWPVKKHNYPILPGFTFDELYEPIEVGWNGEMQYSLKEDFVTEESKEELIKKLSPNKDMYFLFSKDQNPDWDMQEELMNIGKRYHLG